ncbi:hypothetical protein V1478_006416 [Vespula squamosa]|uniref:Uncharacterized protein n=1 Tax=Vespula squamosa TaxID=30214 RepID=A0ABD2B7S2_VESSQ
MFNFARISISNEVPQTILLDIESFTYVIGEGEGEGEGEEEEEEEVKKWMLRESSLFQVRGSFADSRFTVRKWNTEKFFEEEGEEGEEEEEIVVAVVTGFFTNKRKTEEEMALYTFIQSGSGGCSSSGRVATLGFALNSRRISQFIVFLLVPEVFKGLRTRVFVGHNQVYYLSGQHDTSVLVFVEVYPQPSREPSRNSSRNCRARSGWLSDIYAK